MIAEPCQRLSLIIVRDHGSESHLDGQGERRHDDSGYRGDHA
jgi:hypothetical protein